MDTQPQPHPAAERLREFALGRLDDDAAEAVAAHLAVCEACAEAAGEQNDSFTDRVKKAGPPSSLTVLADLFSGEPALPPDDDDDRVPAELTALDGYEVIRRLGRGGMGGVYLARNLDLDRFEVFKVIRREFADNAAAADRFRAEMRAVARLNHPNVAAAHAVLRAGEMRVFVQEYVDGLDLDEAVDEHGPLPIRHACEYIRQAALGLQHAHEAGVVHRDVKPGNLMLSRQGRVKVLDFGLARRIDGADAIAAIDPPAAGRLTRGDAVMGTPGFLAPEQVLDPRAADARSDIYSLGCTLFYLLTGQPPFDEDDVRDTLSATLHGEPRPLHELRAEVPAGLIAVLGRMIAREPADRFATPADVARALQPLARGAAGRVTALFRTRVTVRRTRAIASPMQVTPPPPVGDRADARVPLAGGRRLRVPWGVIGGALGLVGLIALAFSV